MKGIFDYMKLKLFFLVFLMTYTVCSFGAEPISGRPADPQASVETKRILSWFYQLTQRSEKKILSGQFLGWYPHVSLQPVEEIFQKSGKEVALIGVDYYETLLDDAQLTQPALNNPPRWKEINPLIKTYWKKGGLTTISCHLTNPWTGGKAWDMERDVPELLSPETPAGKEYRRHLAMIADGLDDLQKGGVVVLFRPFHEMDYAFWWGNQKPEVMQKLWRQMFDYFTKDRQLHHLIWVYNGSMSRYPGNEYVDLVSYDYYSKSAFAAEEKYNEMKPTGKPFAIGEFGPPGDSHDNTSPRNYNYAPLAQDAVRAGSGIVYFLAWRDAWGMHNNNGVKELLNDPLVLNLDDLQKELKIGK